MNSYRPVLELYQKHFGGVVDVHHQGDEKFRLTWEWRAYGNTAAIFLLVVLPLLREKAPQAYLGLHYRTLPPRSAARRHAYTALCQLKKTTHYRGAA